MLFCRHFVVHGKNPISVRLAPVNVIYPVAVLLFAICYSESENNRPTFRHTAQCRHDLLRVLFTLTFTAQPCFEVIHPIAGIRELSNLAAGLCINHFELLRAAFSFRLRGLSIGLALAEFFCVSRTKFLKSLETHIFVHSPVRFL